MEGDFAGFQDQNSSCEHGKCPSKPPFSIVSARSMREPRDIRSESLITQYRSRKINFRVEITILEAPWYRDIYVMGGTRAAPIFLTRGMESSDHVDNPR